MKQFVSRYFWTNESRSCFIEIQMSLFLDDNVFIMVNQKETKFRVCKAHQIVFFVLISDKGFVLTLVLPLKRAVHLKFFQKTLFLAESIHLVFLQLNQVPSLSMNSLKFSFCNIRTLDGFDCENNTINFRFYYQLWIEHSRIKWKW